MAWKRTLKSGEVRWEDKVYFKTPDGFRTQTVRGRTRAEVLKAKAKLTEDRDRKPSKRAAKPGMTLGELGEQFTTRHVAVKEPSTQAYYKTALRYRIAPYLYERKIRDLHRADIDEWIADLHTVIVTDKQGRSKPRHSARNINAALSTLKVMLAKGVEWGILDSNVAAGVPKMKEHKAEIRVYPPDDVGKFCQAVATIADQQHDRGAGHLEIAQTWAARDMAMIMLMSFTGVRLGELLALRWHDIDGEWLRIEKQTNNRTGLATQTKSFRSRSVPILEPTARALAWWKEVTPGDTRLGLIFPSRRGGSSLRQNTWRERVFKPAADLAGMPKAKPHELRHTFASLMIARGVTPLRLSKWMGHSDPMTTMRVYAHLFDRVEDDIITKINASLYLDAVVHDSQ